MSIGTDILGFIGGIFKPAVDLIDNVHTSEEEKLQLRNELVKTQSEVAAKMLEYESKVVDIQAQVMTSEAKSNWFTASWRPITMITFLVLVVCDSFGLLPFRLANEAWELLKIGIGGYIGARSIEKVLPGIFTK